MSVIGFGKRNQSFLNHWQEIEMPNIKRPCVIALGGSRTLTPQIANGYCKVVERMLGVLDIPDQRRPFDIYGVFYKDLDYKKVEGERLSFLLKHGCPAYAIRRSWPRYYSVEEKEFFSNPPYCQELYQKLLKPLITDRDGTKRISYLQASKALGRINFITHSHGGYVVLKLQELLEKDMKLLGYSQEERTSLLQQVSLITCAGAQIPYGYSKMTTAHFSSLKDPEFSHSQDETYSLPFSIIDGFSKTDQAQENILITLPNKNENVWLVPQFERGISYRKDIIAEHEISYFWGETKNSEMSPEGKVIGLVASALLQANLSESLRFEQSNQITSRQLDMRKILNPVLFDYKPFESLNKKGSNQVAIKGNMIKQAAENGEKFPISFIPNLNLKLRDEMAKKIKQTQKLKRRDLVKQFHYFNPFNKTSLKESR